MKKIILFVAAACALVACDPIQEDITNDGNITEDAFKESLKINVCTSEDGTIGDGNWIVCETSAPVNAMWNIGGKGFNKNAAKKKMALGDFDVVCKGLCADGTLLEVTTKVSIKTITDPLTKYYIYGEPGKGQEPFSPGAWDAAAMRFSDNEGKYLPFLKDDIYWGFKTLIFDISDAVSCSGRIMNGWWSARYDGDTDVTWEDGLWELPLTAEIAKDCASSSSGGSGKDLDIMVTSGSMTVNSVYYEE